MDSKRSAGAVRLVFAAAGAVLLVALGTLAPPEAEASVLKVTVNGSTADRQNVTVKIVGQDTGTNEKLRTTSTGVVQFSVPGDSYSVTPSRNGFRFTPASRLIRLPARAKLDTSFSIAPLPAVGALEASQTSLVLRQTFSATVVVTATDRRGNGILGAPVKAASSDALYLKVEPARVITDSLGRARFTLTAFGSIAFSGGPETLPLGNATVTYTSGGWRGTPVRTAQTAVTVEQGLAAELWVASGHADADGEPFTHWDADGSIPTSCARCHSKPGYIDYVADGTVNAAAPIGTVIDCFACHDPASWAMTSVTFPSGVVVAGLGREAICSTCHQGRESGVSVDTKLAGKPEDTIDATISFTNIHYYAAAATLFGGVAKGGYQYAGMPYGLRFPHVSSANVCQECHDPHSLALRVDVCRTCHPGAVDYAGIKNIRMAGSTQDYDGDGNVTEGVAAEIDGVAAKLYETIQEYAAAQGLPIIYDGHTYPYFLYASDRTGYKSFTPRLLKACYNYQVYQKDPGRHGHNAKYMIELLHDSIQDLASQLPVGSVPGLARNDLNHFNTASEAFRHWDVDPNVSASCSRCHGGEAGFRNYLTTGTTIAVPQATRMSCETCHTGTNFGGDPPRRYVDKVVWPTYAADPAPLTIYNDPANPDDSFICMTCHQGRRSKRTYDDYLSGYTDDQVMPATKTFQNIHYLSAGGTLYGKQAGVGYEYAAKTYNLKFNHWGGDSPKCFYCHDVAGSSHTFLPRLTPVCGNCHTEIVNGDIRTIRLNRPHDYDGDGNTTETLKAELDGLRDVLHVQMRVYAAAHGGPIAYSPDGSYYYFDANDNALVDPGEVSYTSSTEGVGRWTPRLMKAAHNFHMTQKEPGYWSHNTNYTAQLLIDSIADLGGNVGGFDRPVGF